MNIPLLFLPLLLLGACATARPTSPAPPPAATGLTPSPAPNRFEASTLPHIAPLPFDTAAFGTIALSPDESELLFTATGQGLACPQVFRSGIDGSHLRLISPGQALAQSPLFGPGARSVLYASTHRTQTRCLPSPPAADAPGVHLSPHMDLWQAGPDGQHPTPLVALPGYQGDPALSPDGTKLVYTSVQDGDANLFLLDLQDPAAPPLQLTHTPGYESDVAWSPDGTTLAFSAYSPSTPDALTVYQDALAKHHVTPPSLDLHLLDLTTKTSTLLLPCPRRRCTMPAFSPTGDALVFAADLDAPHPSTRLALFSLPLNSPHPTPTRLTYGAHHFDFAPRFGATTKDLFWRSDRLAQNAFSMVHSPLTLPLKPKPSPPFSSLASDLDILSPPTPSPDTSQAPHLRKRLESLGLLPLTPPEVQRLPLIARLPAHPPQPPTSRALLLGAHHHSATGLAVLLATLEHLSAQKERLYDVIVVVLDGPDEGTSDAPLPPSIAYPLALLYFDHLDPALTRLEDTGAPMALKELVRLHQGPVPIQWAQGPPTSPHLSFVKQGIPTLSFFSTPTPTATPASDLEPVAALAARIATALLQTPRDLVFTPPPHAHPPQAPRLPNQARVTFGSMPSYTPPPDGARGVLVSSVLAHSPAQQAGLLAGDVITRFGTVTIATPEDLMRALQAARPGDTVEVHILRQGAAQILKATLTPRGAPH